MLALRRIRDKQVFVVQCAIFTIEGDEMLTFFSSAHHDGCCHRTKVVSVHRLAQIQHDVVGDVDGQAD